MINDLPMRKPDVPKPELIPIIPCYGIGDRVCYNDGVNDIAYVSGIIIRGAGMFTYLVSEKGMETEVRDFEILGHEHFVSEDEEEAE